MTTSGEVELEIPRLRTLPFETQIIKRYQTKQSRVERVLIEMLSDGIFVRLFGKYLNIEEENSKQISCVI